MLKIKQNIDLKELEKYGFTWEDCCDDIWYTYYFKNIDSNTTIRINYSDREIEHLSYNYDYENDKWLDTLYDLIKADLVEKVE